MTSVDLAALTKTSRKIVTVILFKNIQVGFEQFRLRDDHHVEARSNLVSTKDLSNESLGAISIDRSPQFARCGDPQPADRQRVGESEERAVAAVNPGAALVDQLKFGSAANPFVRLEPHSVHSLASWPDVIRC